MARLSVVICILFYLIEFCSGVRIGLMKFKIKASKEQTDCLAETTVIFGMLFLLTCAIVALLKI